MRFIKTADLIPGMMVGREVLSREGVPLLNKDAYITQKQIDKLLSWGVPFININDGVDAKAEFMNKYEEVVKTVKDIFEEIRLSRQIPVQEMHRLVDEMIKPLISVTGVLEYLCDVKMHSDYTFQHSVHVAVIMGVFSGWLNYRGEEYKNLVMTGLLHDVGKLSVPITLLDKTDRLLDSEFEIIKQHSEAGYKLIEKSETISSDTKMGVLQHHERTDGSGYPFGVKSSQIHTFAKIVAVADIYDAMTSDRAYRSRMTLFAAMKVIEEEMHHTLDAKICLPILTNMQNYFIGVSVLLSDGQKAKIIAINSQAWLTPIVQTWDGIFLDLRKESLNIVDVI